MIELENCKKILKMISPSLKESLKKEMMEKKTDLPLSVIWQSAFK